MRKREVIRQRRGFLVALGLLAACTNNPYPAEEAGKNWFYSTFAEAPKHLDPAMSYSANEYVFVMDVYEPPLQYHYLKRPYELVPLTAVEVPAPRYYDARGNPLAGDPPEEEVARAVYTIRVREGIRFQDHPCFARDESGRPLYHDLTEVEMRGIESIADFPRTGTRELTAADYVHQIKRLALPGVDCPVLSLMASYVCGLDRLAEDLQAEAGAARNRAERGLAAGAGGDKAGEAARPLRLDLERFPLEGARLVDRYTYQIVLKRKYPQFVYWLAMPFFAPVPPEADAFFAQAPLAARNLRLDNSPVGTGAYRMAAFRPNREIVLAANENFHPEVYPGEGETGDREKGLLADAGKPLPFVDRAVFKRETEAIPRWTKFLQGYYDSSGVFNEVFDQAVQFSSEGRLEPSEAMTGHGIRMLEDVLPSTFYFAFNMLDDVVGGLSEPQRRLRQAISIAVNIEEWVQIFDNGLGLPAQSLIPPGIFGHVSGKQGLNQAVYDWDPQASRPARRSIEQARRLLAQAGYPQGRDRQGRPLVLHFDTYWTGAWAKSRLDWLRKQLDRINVGLQVRQTDYNRFQDKVRRGDYQLLFWGWNADYPDPENFLFLLYGPNGRARFGGENVANYANPEFDRLFHRLESMPNGADRLESIRAALRVAQEDCPLLWGYHPVSFGLYHRWYRNAKPLTLGGNTLKYLRIDAPLREGLRREWNRPVLWPVALCLGLVCLAALPAAWAVRARQRRPGRP